MQAPLADKHKSVLKKLQQTFGLERSIGSQLWSAEGQTGLIWLAPKGVKSVNGVVRCGVPVFTLADDGEWHPDQVLL